MDLRLTNSQLDKLSDLSLGLGQMLFGSAVLPYLIPSIDKPPVSVLFFGLIFAIILWSLSLVVVKGVKI